MKHMLARFNPSSSQTKVELQMFNEYLWLILSGAGILWISLAASAGLMLQELFIFKSAAVTMERAFEVIIVLVAATFAEIWMLYDVLSSGKLNWIAGIFLIVFSLTSALCINYFFYRQKKKRIN